METDDVVTKIWSIDNAVTGDIDTQLLAEATTDIRRIRAWLDARETMIASAMVGRVTLLERDLADAAKITERAASRIIERAATASTVPALAEMMAAGDTSGAHLDVITAATKTLEPAQRARFREHIDEHAGQAGVGTVDDYRAFVHDVAQRIRHDDGSSLLERQKRDTRLRAWTDRNSGMYRISGTFDPESGVRLAGRLAGALSRLMTEPTPVDAPSDPSERVDFLRAHALLELSATGSAGSGRPELMIVIDTRTTHLTTDPGEPIEVADEIGACHVGSAPAGSARRTPRSNHTPTSPTGSDQPDQPDQPSRLSSAAVYTQTGNLGPDDSPLSRPPIPEDQASLTTRPAGIGHAGQVGRVGYVVDWGIPVTLPWSAVERVVTEDNATVHAVVLDGTVVVHAPGRLDLGRSTRLANQAQRRALRALYPTCAVPGCDTHFNHTEAHHVISWENGGPTNLDNLLPLCSRHHHNVHDDGWHLHLNQRRHLTITLPNGTQLTGSPPTTRHRATTQHAA